MKTAAHEFAFYVPGFSVAKTKMVLVTEGLLLHRLQHVLRVGVGDTLIFFDDNNHALCTITASSKKQIVATYESLKANKRVEPLLFLIVPLLKREALDEVVYSCRELGVSGIYLVSTQKSSRSSLSDHEWERLERVSIAAAEQSKNFAPCPFLNTNKKIKSLTELIASEDFQEQQTNCIRLLAQPFGAFFYSLVPSFTKTSSFMLCFGPEGDLTEAEQLLLQKSGFISIKLGPTVLRAQQAATLLVGLIRSSNEHL